MRQNSDAIIAATRAWIGTPYRHQASALGAGCDCLGLLRGVWRSVVGAEPIKMPPYRADWRDKTNAHALQQAADEFLVVSNGEPRAGDVILFKMLRSQPPKHCGIMIADNVFVHAQEQIGVVEANLTDPWQRRVAGIYHFPNVK